ncbi:hypothetical protein [Brevundimonas diminuta]|uniref:hypothetical protein n=1 Tax=Brevundimonas diminuta TaxID=293 RepID=UPI0020936F1F|nr:hypothetical protein [Brevundimonas diminuta]
MTDDIRHPSNLFGCAISPYHDDLRRNGRNMRRPLWLRDAATIARPTPSIAKLI